MTKTLYLLRHTKALDAGPADPSKDHARGLALRGQKDGKSLAMFFAAEDIHVDRIYCSTYWAGKAARFISRLALSRALR